MLATSLINCPVYLHGATLPREDEPMPLPSMDELRAAGLELRIGAAIAAVPGAAAAIDGALRLERYLTAAQSLGVSRERADEIVRTVQGLEVGSSPTTAVLAEAQRRMIEEAMSA